MTLVSSGPISLAGTAPNQSVEIELGGSGTTIISLNDSNVRTLLGVPSGQISLSNAYGKSNRVILTYTFTTNTANATLNVSSIGGYTAGKSDITITVNSGVYIYSTTTSSAGLSILGSSAGDTVTLVNNGYICGQGGNYSGNGGTALSLSVPIYLTNNSYIGGGGGGGGGPLGGGGAGGGSGASATYGAGAYTGGTGGSTPYPSSSGGGGGSAFPGTGGAASPGGGGNGGSAGGGGTYHSTASPAPTPGPLKRHQTSTGGGGGGWGAAGGIGYSTASLPTPSPITLGSDGGAGGSGNAAGSPAPVSPATGSVAGGGGGNAISLNGNSITYNTSGTIWGAVA